MRCRLPAQIGPDTRRCWPGSTPHGPNRIVPLRAVSRPGSTVGDARPGIPRYLAILGQAHAAASRRGQELPPDPSPQAPRLPSPPPFHLVILLTLGRCHPSLHRDNGNRTPPQPCAILHDGRYHHWRRRRRQRPGERCSRERPA
jgi:hypothetical protein